VHSSRGRAPLTCSAALEDQTELVAIGISHRPPAVAIFIEVRIGPTSSASKLDDARSSDLNVVDDDVHVHTILHDFWFGYSLERNMWRVRILLMKIHELRWTPQPALDFDPENQLPKGRRVAQDPMCRSVSNRDDQSEKSCRSQQP